MMLALSGRKCRTRGASPDAQRTWSCANFGRTCCEQKSGQRRLSCRRCWLAE
uniref:Uncharacterized protein n=1 Tax=Macrostomum lignano TaxID=282301 RepID=A0A1I8FF69_9PLAT